jgi:hypothetical protein
MKKLSCVLAALATIAVAAPTVASAEGFSFRIGSDRDYYRDYYRSPRAEFYGHDRGWHRGWYDRDGDRTVIIRRHHYWECAVTKAALSSGCKFGTKRGATRHPEGRPC